MKTAAIALGIFSVLLIGAFYFRHTSANKQLKAAVAESSRFSNECQEATLKLTEQKRVNIMLFTNLTSRNDASSASSNSLGKMKMSVAETEEATKAARAEIEEREKRITDWETSHSALAEKANELNTSLGALKHEIANVKKKLDASEGDRAFLLTELRGLQAERDQLTEQFNDVAVVRAQLEKLRNEKVMNKRFTWANTTLIRPEYKGGEMLIATEEGPKARPNYGLRVELQQDGSVRLVSPTGPGP